MLKEFFINLVKEYGYIGIFIIGFSEPIFQPFPVEIFLATGVLLGLDWRLAIIVSTVASNLGACVTYFLAVRYGEKLMYKLFDKEKIIKGRKFLEKYGVLGVVIASFTPIPFEVICWVCASFEMPFPKYMLAVFISRLIKHSLAILPIVLGKKIF
ncbi:YqaA family protein [Methanocaldococcus indicus]|uniref:YqaA family protein n=1 Tax=Methanocaldococcus indicus TaxID=213231 RepID=UPI003C6D60F8